jgi:predicted RNase H-like HicB family nuclease
MHFTIEVEREVDKRWIAEVVDLPGVMAYGATRKEAVARAQALALRVLADRIEHGEKIPAVAKRFVVAA